MPSEKNLGVTISRTLVPTLPPEYLSRRHLFPLLDNDSAGTTFVIALPGYGRTTLVSEWAQNQKKAVIWMTVANGDTTNEMSAMLIAATRRVAPNFAPWFETDQPIRPTEVVRRWGNDLLQSQREFIFVLDNLRISENEDVKIASQLIEQFPRNVHFVALRSNEIEGIYGICASRGPIKVITTNELRFTDEEIDHYAVNVGLELTEEFKETLRAGAGWPAATALLAAHLQARGANNDLQKIMSSSVEPLRSLVELVIDGLDKKVVDLCKRLAVLEVFTLDEAKLILQSDFDLALISAIAHKGEIFAPLRDAGDGFAFSPMVRQVLLEKLGSNRELKISIHKRLIAHFESLGNASAAITHAFEVGDTEKISLLFPEAVRVKQAQGKGGEILRWAKYAGQSPEDGALKKSTVVTTGLLADIDFQAAQSEIATISLMAEKSADKDFYKQFADGASAYSLLTLANFPELEEVIKRIKIGTAECKLGIDDQINILRILCTKRYLWNESVGVEEVYQLSQTLGSQTTLFTSHTFLQSIYAMHLHQRGEYRRAYDISKSALAQYRRYRFVGNHGPLDVMYVMARCQLEFSNIQEALLQFENIRSIAYQWKQWHWYFFAGNHITEHLTFTGKIKEALDRVAEARKFASEIDTSHQLEVIADLAEMNARRKLKDFDRLEKLVNRAPDIRHTQQYRLAVDEFRGRKSVAEDVKNLPEHAPREVIWKYLAEASINIDKENVALPAMHKAMKVGAEVGAKETFLRQRDELGNLIIRIANDFPTVYNEELAAAMAERINQRGNNMNADQPSLTKRELEILRQLSTGRTLTVIASELHISQNTMKTHLKNLYKKIGAEGRHDAVEKAKASFLL